MIPEPGSLEKRFPQLVHSFGLTGHELSREVLSSLPDPLPERQLPALLEAGIARCHSRHDFVRACGYSNISKGCRRLDSWLSGTKLPMGQQVAGLAAALAVAPTVLSRVMDQDLRVMQMAALKARARDPSFHLVIRIMAAIYNRVVMDPDLQLGQALAYACRPFTKQGGHFRRCLTLPTSLSIYISRTGTLESYGDIPPAGGLELPGDRPFVSSIAPARDLLKDQQDE